MDANIRYKIIFPKIKYNDIKNIIEQRTKILIPKIQKEYDQYINCYIKQIKLEKKKKLLFFLFLFLFLYSLCTITIYCLNINKFLFFLISNIILVLLYVIFVAIIYFYQKKYDKLLKKYKIIFNKKLQNVCHLDYTDYNIEMILPSIEDFLKDESSYLIFHSEFYEFYYRLNLYCLEELEKFEQTNNAIDIHYLIDDIKEADFYLNYGVYIILKQKIVNGSELRKEHIFLYKINTDEKNKQQILNKIINEKDKIIDFTFFDDYYNNIIEKSDFLL